MGAQYVRTPSGIYVPSTVVQTNQANTYTTGAQSFAAATSLLVPASAGYAPTANGSIGQDTTQKTFVWGQNGLATVRGGGILSVQTGGDTNDSSTGSGADYNHTLTYVIPAALLNVVGKILRVTSLWKIIPGSGPPTAVYKVKFGSTVLWSNGGNTPQASTTGVIAFTFYLVTATTGATGTIQCAMPSVPLTQANMGNSGNLTAQPVTVDLTSAQTLTHTSRWSAAGTGTNQITLLSAIVEIMN